MKRRVLVVDDDRLTLEILATILDLEHFEVTTAAGGAEALASLDDDLPDLVVCDVMMPEVDGLEVTRRIRLRTDGQDLPIVLLTARDRPADRTAGMAAGATVYVTKPFSPLALIRTLSELAPEPRRRVS